MKTAIADANYVSHQNSTVETQWISAEFERSVTGYVLPHRKPEIPTFQSSDAPLYVSRRQFDNLIPGLMISDEIFPFEEALFQLYWNNVQPNKRFVFLTGTVGSGKSTLIDYFLRCYCPEKLARDGKKEQFSRKLILHVDLKGVTSRESFYLQVLLDLKASLETAKISENFEDDFNAPGDKDERILKILQSVSSAIDDSQIPQKFITLVLDNIDQSPTVVQREAITFAQNICEASRKISIYRVFFPLWPQTIAALRSQNFLRIKPEEYVLLDLTPPDLEVVAQRKMRHFFRSLKARRSDAREFIKSVREKIQADQYIAIHNLAYRNIATTMDLMSELMLSEGMREYDRETVNYFRDYQIHDSLLCGRYATHNEMASYIFNPFIGDPKVHNEQSMFILPYLMSFLTKQHHEEEDVMEFFAQYGFPAGLIEDAITKLSDKYLLHRDLYREGRKRIDVHRAVRREWIHLLFSPAALDNWAQTTPMSKEFVGDRLPTVGYKVSDFPRRVENTVNFLRYLSREEQRIVSRLDENELTEFRSFIPSISRQAMESYSDRLTMLKRYGKPRGIGVGSDWWQSTIDNLDWESQSREGS